MSSLYVFLTSTVTVAEIPNDTEFPTTGPAGTEDGRETEQGLVDADLSTQENAIENSTHVSSEGETIGKLDTCVEFI